MINGHLKPPETPGWQKPKGQRKKLLGGKVLKGHLKGKIIGEAKKPRWKRPKLGKRGGFKKREISEG